MGWKISCDGRPDLEVTGPVEWLGLRFEPNSGALFVIDLSRETGAFVWNAGTHHFIGADEWSHIPSDAVVQVGGVNLYVKEEEPTVQPLPTDPVQPDEAGDGGAQLPAMTTPSGLATAPVLVQAPAPVEAPAPAPTPVGAEEPSTGTRVVAGILSFLGEVLGDLLDTVVWLAIGAALLGLVVLIGVFVNVGFAIVLGVVLFIVWTIKSGIIFY